MTRAAIWIARASVLALLPLAACSSTESAIATGKGAVEAQTTSTLSTTDATFINQAANGGAAEVQAGELAASNAGRPPVRRFAQQMVSEHTKVNQELAMLAQSKGITAPSSPDLQHQQMLDSMKDVHGRAFERGYLDAQVADHQAMLAVFQTEAQQGTDPDLKAFAARIAPSIRHHLELARKLGGHAPTA